jgi:hypothetical protein
MPKILYLDLNISKSEILSFDEQFQEKNGNLDNFNSFYPDPSDIKPIQPIEYYEETIVSNNDKQFLPSKSRDFNFIDKNSFLTKISLTDSGNFEKINIYNSQFVYDLNEDIHKITNNIKEIHNKASIDSCCWWCCHDLDINKPPIPLPVKYDDIKKTFKCRGVFCSFNCCLSYSVRFREGSTSLVYYLYKRMYGLKVNEIDLKRAPPRETLQKFGGFLSIDAYRSSFENKTKYEIVEYPIIYISSEIRETCVINILNKNTNDNAINMNTNSSSNSMNNSHTLISKYNQSSSDILDIKPTKKKPKRQKNILSMLQIEE